MGEAEEVFDCGGVSHVGVPPPQWTWTTGRRGSGLQGQVHFALAMSGREARRFIVWLMTLQAQKVHRLSQKGMWM